MPRVTSGSAGAPLAVENLRPLYSGGLWLAVMLRPPARRPLTVACATAGVGRGVGGRVTRKPWAGGTFAAPRGERTDRKPGWTPSETPPPQPAPPLTRSP